MSEWVPVLVGGGGIKYEDVVIELGCPCQEDRGINLSMDGLHGYAVHVICNRCGREVRIALRIDVRVDAYTEEGEVANELSDV